MSELKKENQMSPSYAKIKFSSADREDVLKALKSSTKTVRDLSSATGKTKIQCYAILDDLNKKRQVKIVGTEMRGKFITNVWGIS